MKIQPKPIIHGRDHRPDGVDPIPGIGGISFDTYPQDGNWLYVETDDSTGAGGSPDGYGIELTDYTSGEGGVFVGALGGGDVHLKTQGGGQIFLQSTGDITLAATDDLVMGGSGGSVLNGNGVRVLNINNAATDAAVIGCTDLDLYVRVEQTQVIVYKDGDENTVGNPLLVIDATGGGSYHILSGASWVADL